MIEREGVQLGREMSEVRLSAVFKDDDYREPLNKVSKSDTLNGPAARKFQVNLLHCTYQIKIKINVCRVLNTKNINHRIVVYVQPGVIDVLKNPFTI